MEKDTKRWVIGLAVPVVGALVVGLIVALFTYFLSDKRPPAQPVLGVQFGNNAKISVERDVNVAGRDVNVQNIIQGVNEKKLAEYLKKLKSSDVKERKTEIRIWYEKDQISPKLEKALNVVVERIDQELKTSRETIRKLEAEGKIDLAELLKRLNKAFEKGLDELERE